MNYVFERYEHKYKLSPIQYEKKEIDKNASRRVWRND